MSANASKKRKGPPLARAKIKAPPPSAKLTIRSPSTIFRSIFCSREMKNSGVIHPSFLQEKLEGGVSKCPRKNRRVTLGAGRDISALPEADPSLGKHNFSTKFCSHEKQNRYTLEFFAGKVSRESQQGPPKKWKGHPWRGTRYKRPRS